MTPEGFFFWLFFFSLLGFGGWAGYWFWNLVVGPVPGTAAYDRLNMDCLSPLGETLCDNCVDLDACTDENCPYDWVDFGIEVTD